jgi:PAS domain S-box-containing protein
MKSASVLIVDDNSDLVDALIRVVSSYKREGAAIHVIPASRGEEALRIAATDGFDVALVDVKLPDTSGVDLIARLKEVNPIGEVILITGATTVDTALSALRSGAFAFVLKSFRPEELLSTLEQALRKVELMREREELERRYRDLVELADVVVVGLDASLSVVFFNSKASQLTKMSPRAALGLPFLESWIPRDERARVRTALRLTREDGNPREVEASFEVPGDPNSRRIRLHISRAGAVVYGIGVDVTDRLVSERRARESEALSAMGELAMNLAHEIRNPLNAAVLQLHLLGKNIERLHVDAEVRAGLLGRAAIVGAEIARLNLMLTEFLELSRPRAMARDSVALHTLVSEVLSLQEESARARGVAIERELEPTFVAGDAAKLKQVVLNVVVNAIEAMREGGALTARTRTQSHLAMLEVWDTGPGIDPAMIENVFAPFFTTKEAGTGLGLSIVRKIVDQHDGRVTITSAAGKGTTVTVSLPVLSASDFGRL